MLTTLNYSGNKLLFSVECGIIPSVKKNTRGVVYGAREAHNLTGRVRLPAPQQSTKEDR